MIQNDFYKKCLEELHLAAQIHGYCGSGIRDIPEIENELKETALCYLQNDDLAAESGDNADMFYFMTTSLTTLAGIQFARLWAVNGESFSIDPIIREINANGPLDYLDDTLEEVFGLTLEEFFDVCQQYFFDTWTELVLPYVQEDNNPEEYIYMATVAMGQLGASLYLGQIGA